MIKYSEQESKIFGVPFGRVDLEKDFVEWKKLKEEISESDCKYVRLRIQSPRSSDLEEINALAKKTHLLEILRVYRSYDVPVENIHRDLRFEKVNNTNTHLLGTILTETYDDIPFGNYTPSSILKVFPREIQLNALKEYFVQNYTGTTPEKIGYIIYDHLENAVGCLLTDFGINSTYTYYIGIKKEHRSNQIFFRVINFIYFFTKQSNLLYGECAARISNSHSQNALEKSNMKFVRYDWVHLIEK